MKTIVCTVCGKEFEAQTLRARYCPECRVNVTRKRNRLATHQRVQVVDDTDDMRNLCLNCTKPRCRGECDELARLSKRANG